MIAGFLSIFCNYFHIKDWAKYLAFKILPIYQGVLFITSITNFIQQSLNLILHRFKSCSCVRYLRWWKSLTMCLPGNILQKQIIIIIIISKGRLTYTFFVLFANGENNICPHKKKLEVLRVDFWTDTFSRKLIWFVTCYLMLQLKLIL